MDLKSLLHVEWFFLAYYLALHAIYFILLGIAASHLSSFTRRDHTDALAPSFTGIEPPVTVIVPLYNEADHVDKIVQSLLHQQYPSYQVILVNDESSDETFAELDALLSLEPSREAPRSSLHAQPVKHVYTSTVYHNLQVVDKENGGKADALNAGLNYAHYDYICVVDGDSYLEPDSLYRTMLPYLEDPQTILVGGTLAVSNGSQMEKGFIEEARLSSNYWAILQTLEYIRAFFLGRMGWVPYNGLPLVSGAYAIYKRDTIVEAGGYRQDTAGEDLEATLRLHRYALEKDEPYRIGFVAGPTCWTRVPDSMRTLRQQRVSWHESLSQALSMNRGLLGKDGTAGRFTFPFLVIFEWLTPVVELSGYIYVIAAYFLGVLSFTAVLCFGVMMLGVGMLLSTTTLVLEEISFRRYTRPRDTLMLFAFTLLENIGYRQLYAFWKMEGLIKWMLHPGTSLETDRMRRLNAKASEVESLPAAWRDLKAERDGPEPMTKKGRRT